MIDKVSWSAAAGTIIAAILALLGTFGVAVPEFVTTEWALELIGAVVALVTIITTTVGYLKTETKTSPSTIDAAVASGQVRRT